MREFIRALMLKEGWFPNLIAYAIVITGMVVCYIFSVVINLSLQKKSAPPPKKEPAKSAFYTPYKSETKVKVKWHCLALVGTNWHYMAQLDTKEPTKLTES